MREKNIKGSDEYN
jgi:hypothetical protein